MWLHHGQVVGDEHVGQALVLLQVLQQVQDLGLNGHVQSGNRLVAHDELGVHGQSPGDADTLTAAAVQLVGVSVGQPAGEAHGVHQLSHLVVPVLLALEEPHGLHGLGDQVGHAHTGVQRGSGVLKDHLDLVVQLPALGLAGVGDVLPLKGEVSRRWARAGP